MIYHQWPILMLTCWYFVILNFRYHLVLGTDLLYYNGVSTFYPSGICHLETCLSDVIIYLTVAVLPSQTETEFFLHFCFFFLFAPFLIFFSFYSFLLPIFPSPQQLASFCQGRRFREGGNMAHNANRVNFFRGIDWIKLKN